GDTLQEQRTAVGIPYQLGGALNPDDAAVLVEEPIHGAERLAGGAGGGELDVPALAVVGVQLAVPQHWVLQPLFLREAEQLLNRRADVEFGPLLIQRRDEGDGRNVFDQRLELRLLALAGTDVAD